MTTAASYFLMGLPSAGKTTFIAALYHVAETGQVPGCLRLSRLCGDMRHLNRIREIWVDAGNVGRTTKAEEVDLLLDTEGGETLQLRLPDHLGDSFRSQWSDRRMPREVASFFEASLGGLLLIHPSYVKEETLIRNVQSIVGIVGEAESADIATSAANAAAGAEHVPADAGDAGMDKVKPYKIDEAPTQVKLVDLLQFCLLHCPSRPLKLAVVISAWDTIPTRPVVGPERWVQCRLPLLWQFLNSNKDIIRTTYFGVSAQGKPLSEAESLRKIPPADRIIVVDERENQSRDITLPIRAIL